MCPAIVNDGDQRGYIIPIGGGEDKDGNPAILKRFTEIAGGANANIVVVPTASRLEDTGPLYEKIFGSLGAASVSSIPISSREDCNNPEFAERCESASGIFITGGNQLRLSAILGGTDVAQTIRRINARGVPVAGDFGRRSNHVRAYDCGRRWRCQPVRRRGSSRAGAWPHQCSRHRSAFFGAQPARAACSRRLRSTRSCSVWVSMKIPPRLSTRMASLKLSAAERSPLLTAAVCNIALPIRRSANRRLVCWGLRWIFFTKDAIMI